MTDARELVKPLEWVVRDDIAGLTNAESPIGWWYNICAGEDGYTYEGDPADYPKLLRAVFSDLDAAKAAAQVDYAARILSALNPAFLERVERLEKALKPFADAWDAALIPNQTMTTGAIEALAKYHLKDASFKYARAALSGEQSNAD